MSSRASNPPDLAGDLPLFLRNNENLPTSRFGMKISRFISKVNIDSRIAMSIANFAVAVVGKTIFSFTLWLQHSGDVFYTTKPPYIRRDTLLAHAV